MVNVYYKGKQLSKDDEENIGAICKEDQLDLVLVSVTMTDSIREDKERTNHALIQKLSKECSIHKGDIELNLCIQCEMTYCNKCSNNHKDHKTINKKDLTKYSGELKLEREKMEKAFECLGLTNQYSDVDVCKNEREELSMTIDKLSEITNGIKRKSKQLENDFKHDFDAMFPILLEYKEKVEFLFEATQKETTIRFEKQFIDFYYRYTTARGVSDKINNKISDFKQKIDNFKELIAEFNTRTKQIIEIVNIQFNQLKENTRIIIEEYDPSPLNRQRSSSPLQFEKSGFHSESHLKMNSDSRTSKLINNSNYNRLNLATILSPPKEKKALIKSIEQQMKDKKSTSMLPQVKKTYQMNIGDAKSVDGKAEENSILEENITTYYNIEPGTTNLIAFNQLTQRITKKEVDFSRTSIKRFEAYHSTLNFKGHFFISGGYATSKMFHRYKTSTNEFIKLSNMTNGHAYHCLLGVCGNIFALGGFKSKKVEKFSIVSNTWEPMPDLESSRSWPSCVSVDDTYLLLFGGLCDTTDTSNKIIEKLNIKQQNSVWEKIELNCNQPIPFYFGVVNINNETVLLLGGKLSVKEDTINSCYKYNGSNNTLDLDTELTLPNKDEFDGKTFFQLGDKKYGQFSSLNSDFFYLYNAADKAFDIIKFDEKSK